MNIIILAAGISRRLLPLTREVPKCMLPLRDNTTLLRLHFFFLSRRASPGTRITIVGGHGYSRLRSAAQILIKQFSLPVRFIYNPLYKTVNNCYSLYLGLRSSLDDDVVVINSDVLYDNTIVGRILRARGTTLVVDHTKHLTKESMKVCVVGGIVTDIGKSLILKKSYGEYIGLAKIHRHDIPAVVGALHSTFRQNANLFYEDALRLLLSRMRVGVVSTGEHPWIEIDTHDDLKMARDMCPSI